MTWSEPILHVDMDSFFVEVERLDDEALMGQPVAVGGAGRRGVVASASYEARKFGVRSAQPMSTARRMCPSLVVVPPRHDRYSHVSAEVFELFRSFTPAVEGLSLDEAFLDVSGLTKHYESPGDVGHAIRQRIRSQLGLPASVGVASVKFLAKLASDDAKPDGLLWVRTEDQLSYLHAMPVGRMWGVGPATLAALERLGVSTIGELSAIGLDSLTAVLGPSSGRHLHELANARDPRNVEPDTKAKSISVEQTFETDLRGVDVIEATLLGQAHRLASRLHRSGLRARTVTLKVRFADFRTVSRTRTLDESTDGARDLYGTALGLLEAVALDDPVRLLGLGASALEQTTTPAQMSIDTEEEWRRVEDAVAEVRDRFGDASVRPARLIGEKEEPKFGQEP